MWPSTETISPRQSSLKTERRTCYLLVAEGLSIVLHSGPNDEPYSEAFESMEEAVNWACTNHLRIICIA
jgi:hypothetical protein